LREIAWSLGLGYFEYQIPVLNAPASRSVKAQRSSNITQHASYQESAVGPEVDRLFSSSAADVAGRTPFAQEPARLGRIVGRLNDTSGQEQEQSQREFAEVCCDFVL
jgi:hypothetical protein